MFCFCFFLCLFKSKQMFANAHLKGSRLTFLNLVCIELQHHTLIKADYFVQLHWGRFFVCIQLNTPSSNYRQKCTHELLQLNIRFLNYS